MNGHKANDKAAAGQHPSREYVHDSVDSLQYIYVYTFGKLAVCSRPEKVFPVRTLISVWRAEMHVNSCQLGATANGKDEST